MKNFFEVITWDDIGFALITALLLTYVINRLMAGVRILYGPRNVSINYDQRTIKGIIDNCYALFPKESINFRGVIFKRGMRVEVLTQNNRIIKGEIIGMNQDNILCLITSKHIVAHELSQILEMTQIKESDKARRD